MGSPAEYNWKNAQLAFRKIKKSKITTGMRFINLKSKAIVREPLEKDIQKGIVDYLKLKGIEVSVTDSSRVWGKGGGVRKSKVDTSHPDLSCVLPVVIKDSSGRETKLGLAFFIECKTKTGAIKEGQKEKLLALVEQGALCILARDLESVKRVVELFLNKPYDSTLHKRENEILRLLLLDRRKKEVQTALKELL